LFTRADAVTAVSESLLRDLITQYPVARRRSQVIHNGIDPSWFDESHDTETTPQARYVLYVGRLEQIKGVDILLRAWQLFQANAPRVALWLAGDGSEMDDLRALSQHLGVAEQVRFLGRVQARDLGPLYRNAELVVMPSRGEGLPRVSLEAGVCGAICVAARVGGVPEVIEDKITGFLVEPESPNALAQVLLDAIRLPLADRRRMGTAAKERIAQHFSHQKTTDAYEELFRSLVEPRTAISRQ
jgi:glycosyltransferase involved in cell wall biosynthesis